VGVAHLAQLTNSLYSTLGLSHLSNTLHISRNETQLEVVLLIDGLGSDFLAEISQRYPIITLFENQLVNEQPRAHFPSTTVTNLTSFATGQLPGVHGMLGYTVRVPHSGTPERLLNGLKWDERVDPYIWQSAPTLFEQGTKVGIRSLHIAAKRYESTGFTRAALRGGEYFGSNKNSEIVEIAARENKNSLAKGIPTFTYIYINHVDAAGHEDGVYSEKWWSGVGSAMGLIEDLLRTLPAGARLWVTADHGMVNSRNQLILGQNNPLLDGVALIGGEPRARHLYLSHENGDDEKIFAEAIEIHRVRCDMYLEQRAHVFTRDSLVASGLIGQVSKENKLRIGDIVLVPHGDLVFLDPTRAEKEGSMIGHHGGLSDIELNIPMMRAMVS
jgi:hypothetical protein